MFRIPSSVLSQLLDFGIADTSRYVYQLLDYSFVIPNAYLCTRTPKKCFRLSNLPDNAIEQRIIILED